MRTSRPSLVALALSTALLAGAVSGQETKSDDLNNDGVVTRIDEDIAFKKLQEAQDLYNRVRSAVRDTDSTDILSDGVEIGPRVFLPSEGEDEQKELRKLDLANSPIEYSRLEIELNLDIYGKGKPLKVEFLGGKESGIITRLSKDVYKLNDLSENLPKAVWAYTHQMINGLGLTVATGGFLLKIDGSANEYLLVGRMSKGQDTFWRTVETTSKDQMVVDSYNRNGDHLTRVVAGSKKEGNSVIVQYGFRDLVGGEDHFEYTTGDNIDVSHNPSLEYSSDNNFGIHPSFGDEWKKAAEEILCQSPEIKKPIVPDKEEVPSRDTEEFYERRKKIHIDEAEEIPGRDTEEFFEREPSEHK